MTRRGNERKQTSATDASKKCTAMFNVMPVTTPLYTWKLHFYQQYLLCTKLQWEHVASTPPSATAASFKTKLISPHTVKMRFPEAALITSSWLRATVLVLIVTKLEAFNPSTRWNNQQGTFSPPSEPSSYQKIRLKAELLLRKVVYKSLVYSITAHDLFWKLFVFHNR